MSNFSHCTVHDTYPAAGDPCWGCVREFREFGDAKLQAENEKLKEQLKQKELIEARLRKCWHEAEEALKCARESMLKFDHYCRTNDIDIEAILQLEDKPITEHPDVQRIIETFKLQAENEKLKKYVRAKDLELKLVWKDGYSAGKSNGRINR